MRIPPEKIEEIGAANDIVDVISMYIGVKKRGKSYLALCPFHADKNPSMNISQEKQVYHCFSCGASGNVFRFVQEFEKISFIDAVEKLAIKAGISLKIQQGDPEVYNEISVLLEVNKQAAKYFYETLKDLSGTEKEFVYDYLKSRHIKNSDVAKFGIGYAPKNWDSLLKYFTDELEISVDDLDKAGLVKKADTGDRYYDRFRGRLIFPIYNESGKVVAFGGRKLYEDDNSGKYLNSPETRLYVKSKILYGLNFARESITAKDSVIFVEGYMDLIAMHKAEVHNTVAVSGTALSSDQIKLVARYTKNVVLFFDTDVAGIKAAKRSIEMLLANDMNISVITLNKGDDPDSYIRENGKDAFHKMLERKMGIIDFLSKVYIDDVSDDTVESKSVFIKEMISFIGRIPDTIKRALYIKDIALKYHIYESDLRSQLDLFLRNDNEASKSSHEVRSYTRDFKKPAVNISRKLESELLEIFLKGDDEAVSYLESNLEIGFIKDPVILNAIEIILDEYMNEGQINPSKLINKIPDENLQNLISAASIEKYEVSALEKKDAFNILHTAYGLKTDYLSAAKGIIKRYKIRDLENKIDDLKNDGSKLNELVELKKKINSLMVSN
ncbi:DNA primase [soil metagenome]